MKSSASRAAGDALEVRLERRPGPRSGAVQEHSLIRLLNSKRVTDLVRRPSLHISEPQDHSQVGWECVDDGPEPFTELLGQEALLRRRARIERRRRPVRLGRGVCRQSATERCAPALAYPARSGPIDEDTEDPRLDR